MKVTIVPSDNVVIVDGVGINSLDLTHLDPTIHAIQWYGDAGHVEYTDKNNTEINSTVLFDTIVVAHAAALYLLKNPVYTRLELLNQKLSGIDSKVKSAQSSLFSYTDGHKYYSDASTIESIFVTLDLVPEDWTIVYKTSDKTSEGVTNVEVTMTKTEFKTFTMAYSQRQSDYWYEGERIKKLVKGLFTDTTSTTDDQLKSFDIESAWSLV